MKMPDWLQGIIKYVAIEVVVRFVRELLVNEDVLVKVGDVCEKGGRWVTANCREAIGEQWEEVEAAIQDLKNTANARFDVGLNVDD